MNQKLKELAFVGVDTHKDEHTACMTNCFAQPLEVFTVENRPNRIEKHSSMRYSPYYWPQTCPDYFFQVFSPRYIVCYWGAESVIPFYK